jgi:hypothetical protein
MVKDNDFVDDDEILYRRIPVVENRWEIRPDI